MLACYGPSHTDGDLSAYFVEPDVLHCGDTWWNGHYPFIDYSTGGNIKGMIKAAEWNLAKASEKTIVIPGHGKIAGKPELTEYRDMLVTVHDKVAALKKEGKTWKRRSPRRSRPPTTANGRPLSLLATSLQNWSTPERSYPFGRIPEQIPGGQAQGVISHLVN